MKTSTNNGYIIVYKPEHPRAWKTGYVYEHVVAMEEKMGRFMTRNEIVHHIDQCKTNNDPSNLVLMTQSTHSTLHHKTGNTMVSLICSACRGPFTRRVGNSPTSKGYKKAYCSRKCYWGALSAELREHKRLHLGDD